MFSVFVHDALIGLALLALLMAFVYWLILLHRLVVRYLLTFTTTHSVCSISSQISCLLISVSFVFTISDQ